MTWLTSGRGARDYLARVFTPLGHNLVTASCPMVPPATVPAPPEARSHPVADASGAPVLRDQDRSAQAASNGGRMPKESVLLAVKRAFPFGIDGRSDLGERRVAHRLPVFC